MDGCFHFLRYPNGNHDPVAALRGMAGLLLFLVTIGLHLRSWTSNPGGQASLAQASAATLLARAGCSGARRAFARSAAGAFASQHMQVLLCPASSKYSRAHLSLNLPFL